VLTGRPIEIRYRTELRDTAGNPAHAATFIRRRLIVLDAELLDDASEHARILLHELFHFVWVRLGNAGRIRWEESMRSELAARARGEAGWSAEWRKRALRADDVKERTRAWREYCCESFCDTAAWVFGGGEVEMMLAAKWRRERAAWFSANIAGRELRV